MPSGRPILLVEDDAAIRAVVAELLTAEGNFEVIDAATLADARHYFETPETRIDGVLLDITLPDGDGSEFCAWMRRTGHRMPVIMLTGRAAEADIVRGLESGANDYVSKPFRCTELTARLRTQLRIFDDSEHATFTIGPYTFRPATKMLQDPARKVRIRLTDKEKNLLRVLYRAGERPVSRQSLMDAVWGYHPGVTTHTLETHIYRLRQKMEQDPANWSLLITTEGGYRLKAA